ncbi:hypothetical protein SPRG_03261 [Saprolegnia parasitica CBS 223.65]|uniref:Uncharacterized protein n=1 Tax=Saprolegnia parasitica (strain CBS 223.65) TaxID=695850 RepID=A0A067CNE9_SAPPC|nr:hypothetical protein SPRG_03261 [Saprolegnia parasitica CBS 223.65]KDO32043.1 hypothetical protein SPRG_03261 [Saprolegnia parasitica CBS 223.65]|eukprot:XP_012197231.1 hypothetical protein SPRG_03261 [Saprolegnia parasitica CBS 223.65]
MPNTASTLSPPLCEFANVTFPSAIADGAYRVSVKTNKPQTNAVIWLESKKTKLQWQCAIDDFTKHTETNYALPSAVVLGGIKNGLAAIDGATTNGTDAASTTHASAIDLDATKRGLALALTIKLSPEWTMGFSFEMTPIKVEVVDILEARIRDLEEAKAPSRMEFCTLTAPTIVGTKSACTWSAPTASTLLRVDGDSEVVVLQSGLHHVHCSLALNSVTSTTITLNINNVPIKTTSFSSDATYRSNTLDLVHVTYLDAGARITLCANVNRGSANGSMTIILLDRGTA